MSYQPKSFRKFLATSVTAAVVAVGAVGPVNVSVEAAGFNDVAGDAYYADAVDYLVGKNVIDGMPNGLFAPNGGVTRAQAAKIIAVALEMDLSETVELSFTDTKDDVWYSPYVAALVEAGIVDGFPDDSFKPNATITRAELAKMVVEAYDLKLNSNVTVPFTDLVDGAWYENYIGILFSQGIVNGTSTTSFSPNETVTRGQAVVFVHRTEVEEVRLSVINNKAYEVKSVNAIEPISVEYGTSTDEVLEQLPTEIAVTLENEKEATVNVEWTANSDYKANTVGDYTFSGVLSSKDEGAIIVPEELLAVEVVVSVDELVVSSVSATTDKIKKDNEQQLTVKVNDKVIVTVDELTEAGYTVEFQYDSTDAPFNTDDAKELGIIDASLVETFRYAVKVTKGTDEFTSSQQTVEVHDENVVVEVTDVALYVSEDTQWNQDYVTSNNAGNQFVAVAGVNAFGEELILEDNENAVFPAIESITSSDIAVAFYNDGLQILDEGSVTFTIKFVDIEETVDVDIVVVAEQVATSILEDGEAKRYTLNKEEEVFTVVDQYGEVWLGEGSVDYTITSDVEDFEDVVATDVDISEEGTVTVDFTAITEAGTYTVTFKNGDEVLGEITLVFVELDLENVDQFILTSDVETVDLFDATVEGELVEGSEQLDFTVTVGALFDDIELTAEEVTAALNDITGTLQVSSSNEDVATVAEDINGLEDLEFTVTAHAVGTTTITLEQVEGDFVTTLASITLTVENSVPQITNLTLAEDVDAVELELVDGVWTLVDVSQLASTNVEAIEDYMVESVTFSQADNKAIVRLIALYGGNQFIVVGTEI